MIGAYKITAIDIVANKLYIETDESRVSKVAKEIVANQEATNMLKFGCKKLVDKGQCEFLSIIYAELGDMDNAKNKAD